jgi:hypothetical protein
MIGSMMRRAMIGDGSTLTLDFTTGVLDPRLTFTRASTVATYINSSGLIATATTNEPRFDYNPTTLSPRGLLIEGAATNLLSYSEDFSNAAWQKSSTNGSMTLTGTAPDGTATSRLLEENTTVYAKHSLERTSAITISSNNVYTLSVWLKEPTSNSRRYAHIQLADGQATAARYTIVADLQTGTITASGANNGTAGAPTGTGHSITAYPNGWYRFTISMNHVASPSYPTVILGDSASLFGGNNQPFYSATTPYKGLLIWGAQFEAGSGSSYIPTVASQVTRNADECLMTGTNFSDWFTNSAEGSFYAKYSMNNPAAFFGASVDRYAFEVSNSAGTSRVFANASYRVATAGNAGRFPRVFDLGTIDLAPSFVATAAQNTALAWGYKTNDNHLAAFGVTATDNSGTLQTGLDRIHLGASRSFGTTTFLNGCITQLKYWPTRLPDATLQSLTT